MASREEFVWGGCSLLQPGPRLIFHLSRYDQVSSDFKDFNWINLFPEFDRPNDDPHDEI